MTYKINKFFFFCNYSGQGHGAIPKSKIAFYHLTFVLSGKVQYVVNGKDIILEENDAILLVPGTVRERFKSAEHAHYVIFNYNPTKGNEIPSNLFMKNAVNNTIRKLLDSYPYIYFDGFDKFSTDNIINNKINEILPNLFNCILTELFETMKYPTNNINVLNALKYINDNITSSISLKDISNAIHLSREHTARIFKKEIGLTVTEYINKQKVILAKDMLTSNELSLQDIANTLGYENYGYFNKVFKSHFGISPITMKLELKKNK